MPKDYIVSNQIRCKSCGDTPYSGYRHDFRSCKCGLVSVDGGQDYLRRVGDTSNMEEMSITMPMGDVEAVVAEVIKMRKSGRNDLGIALGAIRALRDVGWLKEETG